MQEDDILVEEVMIEKDEETESLPPMGFEVIKREFKRDKIAMLSLVVLILIILTAIIAPFFLDTDKVRQVDIFSRYAVPGSTSRSGQYYPLGANEGGQDILTLLIVGLRNSLFIGFAVTIITSFVGIGLGIMSGYYGGVFDDIMMRILDFLMILPTTMIIIVIVTIIPRFDPVSFITILSVMGWMGTARLFRTRTLSEASKDYVAASKTMGTPDWKIMYGEILPNLSTMVFTYLTLGFAGNIGIETGLTFLGFGLPFGTPSLGYLISTASNPDVIQTKRWVWLPAVLVILVLMLSINYIGQALQRASDSRQRIGG